MVRRAFACYCNMSSTSSLLALPLELQEQIIGDLAFPDNIYLKLTCLHFHAIIKALTHEELLKAELTPHAEKNDIYACRYCLRLRSASEFADNMVKKRRSRVGSEKRNRFCIECGLQSGPGSTRYTRGSHIPVQGVDYVVCMRCRQFKLAGMNGNSVTIVCATCWMATREYKEQQRRRNEEYQREREAEREQALRLKVEQAERRRRRREVWGPSASDSDEDSSSLTWEEEQMAMIQAEADEYMGSPRAGSE